MIRSFISQFYHQFSLQSNPVAVYFYYVDLSFSELPQPAADDGPQRAHLVSGSVLLAREALQDPNFEATVVLVCVHSNDGSYGLVLNRVSHMPVSEIFEGISGDSHAREILIGGPVQQTELQIVEITNQPAEGAFEIAPHIYMGGRWTDTASMINSEPMTTRLFLGYSGWGPGQLVSEVDLGAWDIFNVDLKHLLTNCHRLAGADTMAISSFLTSIQVDNSENS